MVVFFQNNKGKAMAYNLFISLCSGLGIGLSYMILNIFAKEKKY